MQPQAPPCTLPPAVRRLLLTERTVPLLALQNAVVRCGFATQAAVGAKTCGQGEVGQEAGFDHEHLMQLLFAQLVAVLCSSRKAWFGRATLPKQPPNSITPSRHSRLPPAPHAPDSTSQGSMLHCSLSGSR